jgi:tRNA(Met) cytidine acetyltransferase
MMAEALAQLRVQLCSSRRRMLIWLDGQADWCREQLAGPLLPWLQGQGVLIAEQPAAGLVPVDARRAVELLGQTLDFVVMDAFAGFNPNVFGQLCGTVSAGGCVVLLTPPAAEWADYADPEYVSCPSAERSKGFSRAGALESGSGACRTLAASAR